MSMQVQAIIIAALFLMGAAAIIGAIGVDVWAGRAGAGTPLIGTQLVAR
jgi:hypothetical protein